MTEIVIHFGLVVTAGLIFAIAYDVERDITRLVSARNVFLLSIAAWYLVEGLIVPDIVKAYSQTEYNFAMLVVAICLVSFLVGYAASRGKLFIPLFRALAQVDRPDLLWKVLILALFIGFLPLVVISKGNVLAILEDAFVPKARWSGMFQRGRYGGLRDAFLELQMFLRAAIPITSAFLVQRNQPQFRRFIAVCFLIFMFARAFNSGARSQVIEVFLPMAAALYWRMSLPLKRYAIQFGVPACVAIMMVWSAATVVSRNSGDFDWEKANEAKYVGFEMFRELLFLRQKIPELSDYQMGKTYFVQLVNPIPRFLWPGKPSNDAGLELASLQGQTIEGTAILTISPGLIGEMHWNFGIAGVVVLSAFLGHLAKSWDLVEPLAERSIVAFTVFAAGLSIIFLSGRSINMGTLYGLLALCALLVVFTKR